MELILPITFAAGNIDRAGLRRKDEAWLAEIRRAAATRIVAVRLASQLLVGEGPRLGHLPPDRLAEEADLTFLGLDPEGNAVFAVDLGSEEQESHAEHSFEDLRALAATLPMDEAALAAHAVAMIGWHRRHRYCGVCGSATV